MSTESYGALIGGGTYTSDQHTGLALGALGNYAKELRGAQIGVVNIGDRVRGLQVGLFNDATSLRGVQIGLANHANDGLLAWSALLNMGFGDDDGNNGNERSARAGAFRAE
jgi:hypothetical protein